MIYDKVCFNRNWNKSSCSNKCCNFDKCYITSKKVKLDKGESRLICQLNLAYFSYN